MMYEAARTRRGTKIFQTKYHYKKTESKALFFMFKQIKILL